MKWPFRGARRRETVRQRQFSCSGVCGALQSKRLGIENPRCELRSSWHDFYLCHAARETETVAAARRRNGLRLRLESRRGRGSATKGERIERGALRGLERPAELTLLGLTLGTGEFAKIIPFERLALPIRSCFVWAARERVVEIGRGTLRSMERRCHRWEHGIQLLDSTPAPLKFERIGVCNL